MAKGTTAIAIVMIKATTLARYAGIFSQLRLIINHIIGIKARVKPIIGSYIMCSPFVALSFCLTD
jgi:hypothetical protein